MGRGRIKAEPGDPNNSIATRIRTAMTACGMKSVAELGRRIGLPRQTVHRWINGDTKNMTHENLYKVADALQVRARWLAVGDTAPAQIDLGEGDVVGLIKIYETMSPAAREQWLAIGRTLLSMHTVGKGTIIDPYPGLAPLQPQTVVNAIAGNASAPHTPR
ncbi:MAG: helix-turn-helix transcriptional regulator [Burkholderiales bacterium]|nr:helix-turn-helix transcriptional regulator [Burkholderiales bacterium]